MDDEKIEEIAARMKLKPETVKDLMSTGWALRTEYYGVPTFIHPMANMHKAETFSLMKNIFKEKADG